VPSELGETLRAVFLEESERTAKTE